MALRRKLPPTDMKASAKTLAFRLCSDQRILACPSHSASMTEQLLARCAPTALFVNASIPD